MGSPDAPAANAATVWEYVTPGEYRVPSAPVDQTVKTGLAAFWRKLRPASAPSDQLLTSDTDVENLSDERLAGFVPPPAWDDAAAALDRALNGWTDRPPAAPWAVLTLGRPHSGHDKVLRLWAGTRGWRLVREPDVPETLGEHGGWFDDLKGDGSPWVLPRLERCFLRHVHGLALVRALLSKVGCGELGRGIIGCDTWAWAFLRQQWRGQGFPMLVAQAFDTDRMAAWLANLASAGGEAAFRQANSLRYVWPPAGVKDAPTSDYLRSLVLHSRGIPGVAWATWRRSLVGVARIPEAEPSTTLTTVLVRPWKELPDLPVPAEGAHESGLILHALLLHGGLPADVLPLVLPLTEEEIAAGISRLEAAELVSRDGKRLEVSVVGYPAAREFVAGRSFVTD